MGFDVLYLAPIHPIGRTHRKGRNNSLQAGPKDPGSPWAIGARVNLTGVGADVGFAPGPATCQPNGSCTAQPQSTNNAFGVASGAFFARTLQVGARIEF